MGARMRDHDWSGSPLGAPETWSAPLGVVAGLMLGSAFPMFAAWGPSLGFLYNDAYSGMLGGRHPEALGRPFRTVWPEIWDEITPFIDRAMTGDASFMEDLPLRMLRNGFDEETWWTFSYSPIRDVDGTVRGMFCACVETTEKVKTQSALARLNADLEARVEARTQDRNRLWELSSDIMLRCDFGGHILAVNPAWTERLGWSASGSLGRTIFDFIHPDDVAGSREAVRSSSEGHAFARFDNRYRRKDGGYSWISWSTRPDAGVINAVGRDFTAERARTEALKATEDALRHAQKMEAVGQLTGGVAHDFNNLLTVIKSSTDLLKRPGLAEDRRARYIGAISDTVDRAAKITGQLLAFARRQALKPEVFDAGASVKAIGDMMGSLTGSRIRIVTELPDEPCRVDADPSQFDTALVNMAVNARDAMDGEGRLTIRVEAAGHMPAARGQPRVTGRFVAVSITDTGTGIPEASLERIFEPFFTTKAVGQGTGLGLSQVIGFAKQSGGEITVASTPGAGTTFTLYLPRVAAAPAVSPHVEAEPLVDGHGTRVLVVEDNAEVGAFATQTLAELGYVTVWATHAEAALAELEHDAARFDVVFSDVVMPGMNGIDLAHEIRRRHAELPVLLASGYSHVLAEGGTHGFDLLHKPYSVEALSRTLEKVVARHRALRRRVPTRPA